MGYLSPPWGNPLWGGFPHGAHRGIPSWRGVLTWMSSPIAEFPRGGNPHGAISPWGCPPWSQGDPHMDVHMDVHRVRPFIAEFTWAPHVYVHMNVHMDVHWSDHMKARLGRPFGTPTWEPILCTHMDGHMGVRVSAQHGRRMWAPHIRKSAWTSTWGSQHWGIAHRGESQRRVVD